MDKGQALAILRPGSEWALQMDGTLVWIDPNTTPPTDQEIKDCINANAYKEKRASLYPVIQDLADALVHQQMGDGGADLQTYLQKCIAVKNQHPKP